MTNAHQTWIKHIKEKNKYKLEGARESAYLRQVSFYSSPFRKILRGHVRTVPGNMLVKFEVRSFNRFGATSIQRPKI